MEAQFFEADDITPHEGMEEVSPESCFLPSDSKLYPDGKITHLCPDSKKEFCFACTFNTEGNNLNDVLSKIHNLLYGKNSLRCSTLERINLVYEYYENNVRKFVTDPDGKMGFGDSPEWSKSSIREHLENHDKSPENVMNKCWCTISQAMDIIRFNELATKTGDGKITINTDALKSYKELFTMMMQLSARMDIPIDNSKTKKRKR